MDITNTEVKQIPLSKLQRNTGQIPGVPKNPRLIKDEQYAKLLESLRTSNLTGVLPLKVYKYDGKYIVLGGNMRLTALKELKVKEASCVIVPKDTDEETLRKIVLLDNSTFGQWDWDFLANEWEQLELDQCGIEFDTSFAKEDEEPEDKEADAKEKPFTVKMTFGSEKMLKAFVNKYRETLENDYGCTISISGGEL